MVLLLCKFNCFYIKSNNCDNAIQMCQFWQKEIKGHQISFMNITRNKPWFLNIKFTSLNKITKDKLKEISNFGYYFTTIGC